MHTGRIHDKIRCVFVNTLFIQIKIIRRNKAVNENDVKLLADWLEKNRDHKLTFIEKEAVKLILSRSKTVDDLVQAALNALKGNA